MAGRILIVDPVPTNRMVLKAKLSLAHYDVTTAESVKQARILAQTHQFEAALASSALVDHSSNCVLMWMQEMHSGKCEATTFIFMHDDNGSTKQCPLLEQCLSAGADDVLSRPFTEDVLLARIRNLMRDNAHSRELAVPSLRKEYPNGTLDHPQASSVQTVITHVSGDGAFEFEDRIHNYLQTLNLSHSPRHQIEAVPLSYVTRPAPNAEDLGIVLLVAQDGMTERALSVMSQLRSRSRMQDVRIIIVPETLNPALTARAFDMGAHDVVVFGTAAKEMTTRIQIQAKNRSSIRSKKDGVREGLRLAIIDPLTGLYNRRYASHRLQEIQRDCLNSSGSFAVLAFDVDHFKGVNDRHGHTVGDSVLTTLADTLRKNLRDADLICRTGGEEFLVALPKTTKAQASATADRLRQAVGALDISIDGTAKPLHVTVSIGLSVQEGNVPITDMLEQADRALYQAKARGRNVVAIATAA